MLDTNVLISGMLFTGPPREILDLWRSGRLRFVLSPSILEEYERVSEELGARFAVDLDPILDLISSRAEWSLAGDLSAPACRDPQDDKFLACALAAKAEAIISGDKHLLAMDGYLGVRVLTPRAFIERSRRRCGTRRGDG